MHLNGARQRAAAQAAVDATARAALGTGGEVYRRRRIVGVKHRVVFGTRLAIEQVLARCGWTINTPLWSRSTRYPAARGGDRARVNTLCRRTGFGDQLARFQVYHKLRLAHASLRQACAERLSARRGSGERWRPCTRRGGRLDGPRVVAQRGAVVSGAAVAQPKCGNRFPGR